MRLQAGRFAVRLFLFMPTTDYHQNSPLTLSFHSFLWTLNTSSAIVVVNTKNDNEIAMTTLQTGGLSGGGADTAADVTPPQLISGPVNGQPANGNLVFTFNEAIQAGSGKL